MLHTIKLGVGLLVGLLALAVLGFNSFLVEPCLRFALSRVEARTGTQITFEKATGNLLTGELAVDGAHLVRAAEGRNQFDLGIGHLTADVAMLRIFDPEWRFDEVHLAGVKGSFRTVGRQGEALPEGSKVFSAGVITLTAGEIEHVNARDQADPRVVALSIDKGRVDEYRSQWSLYDLLFRGKIEGKLDGEPFRIEWVDEGESRRVLWDVRGLAAGKWAASASGPLAYLRQGKIDCQVASRWPLGDPRVIKQEWKLLLRECKAAIPPGEGGLQALAMQGVVRWISKRASQVPIEFPAELTRDRFDGAQSLKDAGVTEAMSKGASERMVELARQEATGPGGLLDRARSLFNR